MLPNQSIARISIKSILVLSTISDVKFDAENTA